MIIKQLCSSEIIPALDIAKRAFDIFIAPDYSSEGINTFYDFIKPENIKARLDSGDFFIWGAFKEEKMTGVVAIRDNNHISLFSVDPNLHGKGIGRKLMETAFNHVRRTGLSFVTVNASRYAVPVYQKLGFGYTDVEQLTDGIKYTPMKAFLHGKTLAEVTDEERSALFPVILAPHDPKWKEAFFNEKVLIEKLACANEITAIHHYGSTAIPGIYAKPCVDILLEIPEDADLDNLIRTFQDAGYIYIHYATDLSPHIMFIKGYTDFGFVGQTFHIHVRYPGVHDELLFRDYLIDHPEKAKEYELLKLRLKDEYLFDRDRYTAAKGEFIKEILEMT